MVFTANQKVSKIDIFTDNGRKSTRTRTKPCNIDFVPSDKAIEPITKRPKYDLDMEFQNGTVKLEVTQIDPDQLATDFDNWTMLYSLPAKEECGWSREVVLSNRDKSKSVDKWKRKYDSFWELVNETGCDLDWLPSNQYSDKILKV